METKDLNNPVQPELNLDSTQAVENTNSTEPSDENVESSISNLPDTTLAGDDSSK